MIQLITYKPIPDTDLEIGAVGEHASRLIAIRTQNTIEPIHLSTHPRAVLIGRPQREIRQAMKEGKITRIILDKIGIPMSGTSFNSLRKSLDTYIKENLD